MSDADETVEVDPREAIDGVVWDVLRNAAVRYLSGGKIPKRQADRNALVRPYLAELKADHAALRACIAQAVAIEAGHVINAAPERPDFDGEHE